MSSLEEFPLIKLFNQKEPDMTTEHNANLVDILNIELRINTITILFGSTTNMQTITFDRTQLLNHIDIVMDKLNCQSVIDMNELKETLSEKLIIDIEEPDYITPEGKTMGHISIESGAPFYTTEFKSNNICAARELLIPFTGMITRSKATYYIIIIDDQECLVNKGNVLSVIDHKI